MSYTCTQTLGYHSFSTWVSFKLRHFKWSPTRTKHMTSLWQQNNVMHKALDPQGSAFGAYMYVLNMHIIQTACVLQKQLTVAAKIRSQQFHPRFWCWQAASHVFENFSYDKNLLIMESSRDKRFWTLSSVSCAVSASIALWRTRDVSTWRQCVYDVTL